MSSPELRPGAAVGGVAEGSYMQRFAVAKAELLRRAAAAGAPAAAASTAARTAVGPDQAALAGFLADYYRDLQFPDLAERPPADLAGAALAHLELAAHRPQGTAAIRVYDPVPDRDGWTSAHTVVDIVTDDMPFLVDSVTSELVRDERVINLVVHPILAVRRDVAGALIEVHDEPEDRSAHLVRESWIHVEVDLEPADEELARLTGNLRRVLADVTAAFEDWERMRSRSAALAQELSAHRPPVAAQEVDETVALLDWLAADNFTFLGYREYDLVAGAGVDDLALRAVPGTGLGIFRGDPPTSRSFASLSPEVRTKVREKHLLVLTKANSRATVHRRAYLDYVGIKRFGADGEVEGERRFLGLFTAGAYTRACGRSRSCGRRSTRSSSCRGTRRTATTARTCCSSSRRTRATSFSRSRRRRCCRSRCRCSTCRSAGRCACSCAPTPTAGSCRAWCTSRATATPRRCAWTWRPCCARRSARRRSTTRPWYLSRCSRACTSSRGCRSVRRSPTSTRRRWRPGSSTRPARGTTA